MNALTKNRIMCAYPGHCVQPGTVDVPIPAKDTIIVLEFCPKHAGAARRRWT